MSELLILVIVIVIFGLIGYFIYPLILDSTPMNLFNEMLIDGVFAWFVDWLMPLTIIFLILDLYRRLNLVKEDESFFSMRRIATFIAYSAVGVFIGVILVGLYYAIFDPITLKFL